MQSCLNIVKKCLVVALPAFFVVAGGCTNVTNLQCAPYSCAEATAFDLDSNSNDRRALTGVRIETSNRKNKKRQP